MPEYTVQPKEVNEFPIIQEIIDRGLLFRPYRISFY